MPWPHPIDFNQAIQNPALCFRDTDLAAGQVVEDALGMPRASSGNFADVYQIRSPEGKSWAVKCFTRDVGALQQRYQAISDHLCHDSPSFMVQFQYQAEGIKIRNTWRPIVKMDWVEGFALNEFVRLHVDKPRVMYRLAYLWVKLSLQLRRAGMAHGDLQHGNVLLVPGERPSQLSLRLIDYDGMYVPALADIPPGEVGHPNYQHPQRLREGTYNSEVDRFPHLVIYTALRAITAGGRDLLDTHDNGENLLFREHDFTHSTESQIFLDAWQLPDPDVRHLLGHVLLGSIMPLDRVAMLDDIVGPTGRPLGLTAGQERQVQDMLPAAAAPLKTPAPTLSRFSLEELVAGFDEEHYASWPGSAAEAHGLRDEPVQVPVPGGSASADGPRSLSGMHSRPVDWTKGASHAGHGGPLFLPFLRRACPHCKVAKHVLEEHCPHCHKPDWPCIGGAVAACLLAVVLAFVWLPDNQPTFPSVLGIPAALGALILVPLTIGLLVNALQGIEPLHEDALPGIRWPAIKENCPHCGGLNEFALFTCRLCGRLRWARLAMVCAFAVTTALLIAVGEADPSAPGWWQVLIGAARWLGRLLSAVAAFVVFIGTIEAWKLQQRLPQASRLRVPAGRAALVAATLLPVFCIGVLLLGLYSRAAHGRGGP